MSGTAGKILIGLGIAAGAVVLGLILLVLFFPADLVRDRAVAAMEERLDRSVHVGDVGLSLFPSIGAELSDLRIGDSAEPGRPRIEADAIRMNVRLWPLLRRQIEITSIEIDGLDIRARLGDPKSPSSPEETDGARRRAGATDSSATAGKTLFFVVERLALENGRVTVLADDGSPLLELGGISEELSADATSVGDLRLAGRTRIDSVLVHLPSGDLGRGLSLLLEKQLRYVGKADSLLIETANLNLNGLPISVTGAAANVLSGTTSIDLMLNGGPGEVSEVLGYLPADLFPQIKGIESKGIVSVKGLIRGPLGSESKTGTQSDKLDFRLALTLSEGRIVYPGLPDPIEQVGFSANLTPQLIDIRDLAMQSGTSSINAQAKISDYKKNPNVDADLDVDIDLKTYSTMRGDQDGEQMSGRAVGQISVRGPAKDINNLKVAGTVDLSSVRIDFPGREHPLEDVNGRVSIRDKDLTLQSLSGRMGSSDFIVQGTLENYPALQPDSNSPAPAKINLVVRSSLLALDELSGQGEEAGSERGGSEDRPPTPAENAAGFLSSLTGMIEMSADRVRTKETETGAASGLATINRGLIGIERLDVDVFGGATAFQGTVDYRTPQTPQINLKVQVQKASVSDLFASSKSVSRFSRMGGFLTGEIDANATIEGNLSEAQGLNLGTITSIGDLAIHGAEVVNHPVQARLADFFETPELKRLAISEWFQPFRIENGRLYVEKLSIKSEQIELSASGWQSLDGEVEMNFDILLPRELSEGLRKRVPKELIPVLFDNTGSRILAPVRVTGSYESPSVALNSERLASEAQEQAQKRLAEERRRLEEEAKRRARGFLDGLLKTGVDTTKSK